VKRTRQNQDQKGSSWGGKRKGAGRKPDPKVSEMAKKANRLPYMAEVALLPKDLQDRLIQESRLGNLDQDEIPPELLRQITENLESDDLLYRPLKILEAQRIVAEEYGVDPKSVEKAQERDRKR
jgi:hypothetical protein